MDNAQCSSTAEHPVHSWSNGAHFCAGINPWRPESFVPLGRRRTRPKPAPEFTLEEP